MRIPLPLLTPLLSGCCWLTTHTTPEGITRWQSTNPPTATLAAKADRYQRDLEARFQTPAGLVDYRRVAFRSSAVSRWGSAPTAASIPVSTSPARLCVMRPRGVRRRGPRSCELLDGLDLLHDVTGKRGLLARAARHRLPDRPSERPDVEILPSSSRPGWTYRGDVSKDQYAGAVLGLGVTLALVEDPEVRRRVAALAAALADQLIDGDMRIVDTDGNVTTHGDLRARVWGLPIGVNALISLAIGRVAMTATGEDRHRRLWERLVEEGYPDAAYWAHFELFGVGHRVNDHMGYLSIYLLFLLTPTPSAREALRDSERRSWSHVGADRNAFFALVHATFVEESGESAATQAVEALREFPERKIPLPVDLTRPGFNFPRTFLNSRKCLPRTTEGLPLHLRPVSSSYWAADPFALVGRLTANGSSEYAGMDYLLAYWMARFHGYVNPDD